MCVDAHVVVCGSVLQCVAECGSVPMCVLQVLQCVDGECCRCYIVWQCVDARVAGARIRTVCAASLRV